MVVGRVGELWRYPVKSMRGERLPSAPVSDRGIAHDRGYALCDQQSGKIASAKHPRLWGGLLRCQARVVSADGAVCVTLADGRDLLTGQDETDEALSTLTRHRVQLIHLAPRQPEIERYWPDVDGLTLRDTVTSGSIGQGAPEGTFFDFAPLHLLTTATLAQLRAVYPQGQVDMRRFRPNLLIHTPSETQGFVENDWVGQSLQIGRDVRVRVISPVPRCVVPTLPQGELAEDLGILRAVARSNRPPVPGLGGTRLPCLGVYASVEQSGVMLPGDAVRLSS